MRRSAVYLHRLGGITPFGVLSAIIRIPLDASMPLVPNQGFRKDPQFDTTCTSDQDTKPCRMISWKKGDKTRPHDQQLKVFSSLFARCDMHLV
jgi:hypothetical protein